MKNAEPKKLTKPQEELLYNVYNKQDKAVFNTNQITKRNLERLGLIRLVRLDTHKSKLEQGHIAIEAQEGFFWRVTDLGAKILHEITLASM